MNAVSTLANGTGVSAPLNRRTGSASSLKGLMISDDSSAPNPDRPPLP